MRHKASIRSRFVLSPLLYEGSRCGVYVSWVGFYFTNYNMSGCGPVRSLKIYSIFHTSIYCCWLLERFLVMVEQEYSR